MRGSECQKEVEIGEATRPELDFVEHYMQLHNVYIPKMGLQDFKMILCC